MQSAIEYIKALQDLVAQKREHEKEENVPDRVTSPSIDITDGSKTASVTSYPDNFCDFLNSSTSFPTNGFLDALVETDQNDDVIQSPLTLNVSSPIDMNDIENVDPSREFSTNAGELSGLCEGLLTQHEVRIPLEPLSTVFDESLYEPSSYYESMR